MTLYAYLAYGAGPICIYTNRHLMTNGAFLIIHTNRYTMDDPVIITLTDFTFYDPLLKDNLSLDNPGVQIIFQIHLDEERNL